MFGMIGNSNICGERHESHIEGLNEKIESKDIISFSYSGRDYIVRAYKADHKVHIYATGGGKYNKRDGSYFIIKYDTLDDSIFKRLQDLIDKYNVSNNNGRSVHVDGLPAGLGDKIEVEYSSLEKIYKSSNQSNTISNEAIKEIYNVFHEYVKKEGYDFTSEGSNVKLFDDADDEYVQGKWTGKHFGSEIEVTFKDKYVTIKVDRKVTDENVEYVIVEGFVQKNKLKDGANGSTKYDYEDFEGVQCFAKKNYFTMTGYFHKEASSTCDLMNFDKKRD